MQVKVYNSAGEETGTMELPDGVFGVKWNADLVHQVVTAYAANRRRGTAHAKTRGEVRGGGKKPWRQKGTGRARHGSIRSPIWKGGGVTHGPRSEKDYTQKINKKMARRALYATLSAKVRDHEVVVVDDLKFEAPKTKLAAEMFEKFSRKFEKIQKGNGALVALGGKDDAARRAIRNLPYAGITEARNLNAYEVLQYKYILFPKSAIEAMK
ncbi:MAG: 50S ribosomal protein L4 [Patescibacteria group bacterium]